MLLTKQKLSLETTEEARIMVAHALSTGKTVPGWVLETLARADERHHGIEAEDGAAESEAAGRDVYQAHAELARLVAPFTPDLIVLLSLEANTSNLARALGQVRISRIFVLMVVASLALFIVISVSPYLNDAKNGDIFESWGWPLFVNEMFYLSAASVGASFSSLFRLDRELTQGTFLPKDQSSYWVQYTLGVVAGLLLSTVLNISKITAEDEAVHSSLYLRAAALALVGGFSSSVVQRLIQRLIESLEAVLRGAADQEVHARQEANKLRLEEALAKDRMRATLLLSDIQRQIGAGEDLEAIRARVEQASQSVLTSGVPSLEVPSAAGPEAAPKEPRDPDATSR